MNTKRKTRGGRPATIIARRLGFRTVRELAAAVHFSRQTISAALIHGGSALVEAAIRKAAKARHEAHIRELRRRLDAEEAGRRSMI